MAEICLTYLNSGQAKVLLTALAPDVQNGRFLKYYSAYSGVHTKRELSDYGKSLALELLKEDHSQTWTELL